MHKPNLETYDRVIILGTILCDIFIINLVYFSMIAISGNYQMLQSRSILLNICYILSTPFGGVTLTKRDSRVDQIVATSIKSSIYFIFIWCLMVSFSKFIASPAKFYISYFAISTIFMILGRLYVRRMINNFRNNGRNICHIVLVGARAGMLDLYTQIMLIKNSGYKIHGYFNAEPSDLYPDECPYLGKVSDLQRYAKNNMIHNLYCGLSSDNATTIREIIELSDSLLIRFYIVPTLSTFTNKGVSLELLNDIPILSTRQEPLKRFDNIIIKRIFDILFSLTFLLTAFPIIYIIFGALIKISSKGPIFFKQRRNGIGGEEFWCYKFRSMKVNIEADTLQASEHDPRKTKIGDFMRRTNIDELPQFINVLKGEMSIVGPRPHMVKHTKEYSELINEYMVRHFIKPGVTGWAQVNGYRGETKTLDEMAGRIRADIWYIEHWSIWLDLYIIYKTITLTFIGDKKAF